MTAWSRTVPVPACQTIVSESPDCAGTVLASSCWAVVEPVPGSEKELLYSALATWASAVRAISASSQAAMTASRCRKHQRAMKDIKISRVRRIR
jgi:hypothetical protein